MDSMITTRCEGKRNAAATLRGEAKPATNASAKPASSGMRVKTRVRVGTVVCDEYGCGGNHRVDIRVLPAIAGPENAPDP